jgi:hypothetical protein
MLRRRFRVPAIIISSLCLLLLVGLGGTTHAATKGQDSISQSVTQAYGTDNFVQKGMIVKFKPGDSTKVMALDQKNAIDMQGLVVAANDTAVSLGNGNADARQVYVATFGRFDVLVSNQNGPIKAGDYVAISSIDGIGMKADGNDSIILGKANASFDGISNVESSTTLKDDTGKSKGISIGRVSVTVTVSHNPLQRKNDSSLPGIFQQIGSGIANKPVSSVRIYLSLAVLLVSAVVSGSLLYSGVRSGVISIGRNPLAKKSIVNSLLQVIVTSIIVFIIGLFGVYLLLRL